jgi:hypothetical protein
MDELTISAIAVPTLTHDRLGFLESELFEQLHGLRGRQIEL